MVWGVARSQCSLGCAWLAGACEARICDHCSGQGSLSPTSRWRWPVVPGPHSAVSRLLTGVLLGERPSMRQPPTPRACPTRHPGQELRPRLGAGAHWGFWALWLWPLLGLNPSPPIQTLLAWCRLPSWETCSCLRTHPLSLSPSSLGEAPDGCWSWQGPGLWGALRRLWAPPPSPHMSTSPLSRAPAPHRRDLIQPPRPKGGGGVRGGGWRSALHCCSSLFQRLEKLRKMVSGEGPPAGPQLCA